MTPWELTSYGPALQEAASAGAPTDELALIAHLDDALSLPASLRDKVRTVTRFGDIATLRVQRQALSELAALPAVSGLELARHIEDPNLELALCTDAAATEVYQRRPEALAETGAGVVVGVLDWGVDFTHPAFRSADGRTRLLGLWDQRDGAHHNNRWGYGTIHSADDINRALQSERPFAALGYHPGDADAPAGIRHWQGSHGTHVLDIAAGNGRGAGAPGVAPGADLVFVHLARTASILGEENLGDSASVLEAIDYVFDLAGDRPCVINMSVGAHGGPHDGSTCVELGIDQAVWLRDNRAIVNSAGNYFEANAHAQGRLTAGQIFELDLLVPRADPTRSEVEIYYPHTDQFEVTLLDPMGRIAARANLGEQAEILVQGQRVGRVYHLARAPRRRDRLIDIFFYPDAPGGRWQIQLAAHRLDDGRFHAWIERDRGPRPEFTVAQSHGAATTGTLCNGKFSITVGAHDATRQGLPIGSFSSAGPTRDGRIKPELTAPGTRILAARSAPPGDQWGGAGLVTRKSGTSMAAPHVAGTLALMFEAAVAPMPITELRALLFASLSHRPVRFCEQEAIHRYGYGVLDIEAAVIAARNWRRSEAERGTIPGTITYSRAQESMLRDIAGLVFRNSVLSPLLTQQGWTKLNPKQESLRAGDLWLRERPAEGVQNVALVTGVNPDRSVQLLELTHPQATPVASARLLPSRWRDSLLRQRKSTE